MYHVNDTILYGMQGVCRIVEIIKRNFGRNMEEYYVLKPVNDKGSTIYVPVNNENLIRKMRPVLSAEEIHQIIQAMPKEETLWIADENIRKEKYKKIISEGKPIELVRMIKALYQHQQEQMAKGKKLHIADMNFFKEAEKILYDEFAAVLDLEPSQVLPFIVEEIEFAETRK